VKFPEVTWKWLQDTFGPLGVEREPRTIGGSIRMPLKALATPPEGFQSRFKAFLVKLELHPPETYQWQARVSLGGTFFGPG